MYFNYNLHMEKVQMGSLHSTTATFWFHKHQYLAAPLFLGSFYAAMVLVFLIVMFVTAVGSMPSVLCVL